MGILLLHKYHSQQLKGQSELIYWVIYIFKPNACDIRGLTLELGCTEKAF